MANEVQCTVVLSDFYDCNSCCVKFMGSITSNMLAQILGERIDLGKESRNKSKLCHSVCMHVLSICVCKYLVSSVPADPQFGCQGCVIINDTLGQVVWSFPVNTFQIVILNMHFIS